jgi:hypothetical protein
VYSFRFDADSGVLHVEVTGFFTREEADRYFAEQESHYSDARRAVGHLKMLVDGSNSSVQSTEVSQRVQYRRRKAIKSPKDRIAVVVGSNLLKMQTQRTIDSEQIAVFTSVADAESWLGAESGTAQ